MKTSVLLIALTTAWPAGAATVQLDQGDMGVEWIDGLGFRPVDGVQVYGAKYDCPRVGRSWKNLATDSVERVTRCDEPPAQYASAQKLWRPSTAHVVHLTSYPPSTNKVRTLPPLGGSWGYWEPGRPSPPPPHEPEVPPVPLPAAGWLMLAWLGAAALWSMWAKRRSP